MNFPSPLTTSGASDLELGRFTAGRRRLLKLRLRKNAAIRVEINLRLSIYDLEAFNSLLIIGARSARGGYMKILRYIYGKVDFQTAARPLDRVADTGNQALDER